MKKRLIAEIIRAKMFSTRKWVGAEVHDTGKRDYGEPKTKKVRLSDIKASWEGFDKAHKQHGGEENRSNVDNIKDAMRKKKDVPPILVRRNPKGVGYEIVDGNHRYHAHQEVGHKEIPVKELPPFLARGRKYKRFTGARKKGLKLYGKSEKPEFLQQNKKPIPYKHHLDSKRLKLLGLKEFIEMRDSDENIQTPIQ
jgi:hypothetical protein